MYDDAASELDSVPEELRNHPDVKLARLELYVESNQWERGAVLAEELCESWPDQGIFWIKRAFCLHELQRTQEAREVLLAAPTAIHQDAVYLYNLACYEAQLKNIVRSKELLASCIRVNKKFQHDALHDPDLAPIWDSLMSLE